MISQRPSKNKFACAKNNVNSLKQGIRQKFKNQLSNEDWITFIKSEDIDAALSSIPEHLTYI